MKTVIEGFYIGTKSLRKITVRYERLAITYKVLITIAYTVIHIR
ncbi:MAG: hypothetical protein QXY40_00555 [Candidatus Methanomethylicia archaeon]